jgi:protein-tyrosine kinase
MITLTRASASSGRGMGPDSAAEKYQSLVHWIGLSSQATSVEGKTIGVTGCARYAGVSTVAANLAVAAAQSCDRPVLLLDLSCTRPLLATRLGMTGDMGLREALARDSGRGECVKETRIPNLSLLAVNEPIPAQILSTDGRLVNDLLREVERQFGLIVVDLPPIDSGLCFATAGLLNGVLMVIEAQHTNCEAALRAKQRLIHANAAVLGVIMNKYSSDLPDWLDP